MILIDDGKSLEFESAICLGNFDGIHIGHQKIINTLKEHAAAIKLKTVILTFKIHPENFISNRTKTRLITGEKLKFDILNSYGIDILYLHEFDKETKNLSPAEFVKTILVDKLKAKILIAGFNYRFGKNRAGDAWGLQRLGEEFGLKVIIVPAVYDNGNVVSSTLVRQCIQDGDIEKTNRLLNRKYSVIGKVTRGKRKGRELGFPTANIIPKPEIMYPQKGVYITRTRFDGEYAHSVTNIGSNPTVGGINNIIETHMIGHKKELYDKEILIEFYDKIRNECVFESVLKLQDQISKDIQTAKDYFKLED